MSTLAIRLKENWKSGLTVALVSIPLSVSLGVASGATPTAGIITAIWAGAVAAFFGGSKYDIVGPAGALSGILAAYALGHGANMLPMLAIVTGAFIFVSYLLRLERYLVFIPGSTIHGFTLGVGLILALGQLNFALGLDGLTKHPEFISNVWESFKHAGSSHLPTVLTFLAFLIALFVLLKKTPKLPPAIALTPVGIALGYLGAKGILPFTLVTLGSKFPEIKATAFSMPTWHFDASLITAGLTVAAVAILETMLCAKIADGMGSGKYDKRKEMFALGLANVASGAAGGLPATAVLARTALNVKSGATHSTSQGLNALFVLVISLLLLGTFKYIPLAVIAAILWFTAYRMIEQHHFVRMFRSEKTSFWFSIAVAFVTVYWDPIIGILFGTAGALLFFVKKLSKGQFELIVNEQQKPMAGKIMGDADMAEPGDADTLVYSVKGQLAYINSQAHVSRFENMKGSAKNVVLRLRELYFVDLDGVDALDEIIEHIEKSGRKALVTGVNPLIEKSLRDSKRFKHLEEKGLVFPRTKDALESLGYSL